MVTASVLLLLVSLLGAPPPPPPGGMNIGRLGWVHDDRDDIRSASIFESKLVNCEPIPVEIDWSLEFTKRDIEALGLIYSKGERRRKRFF